MPVLSAQEFRLIGKETDRRWERDNDIRLLNPRLVEYRRHESARLVVDPALQHLAQQYSVRQLAKVADVTPRVVRRVRRGDRIRKSTARKLERALKPYED